MVKKDLRTLNVGVNYQVQTETLFFGPATYKGIDLKRKYVFVHVPSKIEFHLPKKGLIVYSINKYV